MLKGSGSLRTLDNNNDANLDYEPQVVSARKGGPLRGQFPFSSVSREHISRLQSKSRDGLPEVGRYNPRYDFIKHR